MSESAADQTVHSLITKAAQLLSSDAELYASQNGAIGSTSASDAAFLSRILSSGTLSDRISALTLMVQSSPVHNQRALESLRSMSMKKGGGNGSGISVGGGKGDVLKSLRALVDWWVGGGVPNRKLRLVVRVGLTETLAYVCMSRVGISVINRYCTRREGTLTWSGGSSKIGSRSSSSPFYRF